MHVCTKNIREKKWKERMCTTGEKKGTTTPTLNSVRMCVYIHIRVRQPISRN